MGGIKWAKSFIWSFWNTLCLFTEKREKANWLSALAVPAESTDQWLLPVTLIQSLPKQVRLIYPKVGRDANMVLIEAIKDGKKGGLKVVPPLIVANEKGEYVPEVMAMLNGC